MYSFNVIRASSVNFVNYVKNKRANFIPRITRGFKISINYYQQRFTHLFLILFNRKTHLDAYPFVIISVTKLCVNLCLQKALFC
jgi:hypothetical protein